ncbi:MAG: nucleotidyltransferase domain-containing protein [Bacteroidota bacterium]|jgi:predicted nucleotidyltransferase|nr:nucleotidyltransferase domain-containing protein [Bacteroidota bacterium]
MNTLSVKSNQPLVKGNPDHRYGIAEKSYGLILAALSQEPAIEQAILFGSRALGRPRNGSDIDLAIVGENCTYKTLSALSRLLNDDLPIPYYLDLVHYNSLEHADLMEHINRYGVTIYRRTT